MKSLIKPAVLATLILILLIPLAMIEGTVRERSHNRDVVKHNIAQSWTGSQTLSGPWMVVEYRRTTEKVHWDEKTREKIVTPWTQYEKLLLRPKQAKLSTGLDVSHRKRGIFKVPVYVGDVSLSAVFDTHAAKETLNQMDGKVTLDHVYTAVSISDARGIASSPGIQWGENKLTVKPGAELNSLAGFHAELPKSVIETPQDFTFLTEFTLRGIEQFHTTPVGFDNQINLTSNWPHPSFTGSFLPLEHDINENGFQANWAVSSFAAGMSLAPEIVNQNTVFSAPGQTSNMGVRMFEPVDIYTQSDRATKYGLLFVVLTFAGFYLFEVLGKSSLHPLQYGLVGLALAIFFLLLLSLSEHIGFASAYSIATAACVGLISTYVSPVFGRANAIVLGAGLTLLYIACYIILMLEDHALLVGSALLFAVLASVMLLTKRIDWYQITPDVRLPRKQNFNHATLQGENS